jgi:hypothetical protein
MVKRLPIYALKSLIKYTGWTFLLFCWEGAFREGMAMFFNNIKLFLIE